MTYHDIVISILNHERDLLNIAAIGSTWIVCIMLSCAIVAFALSLRLIFGKGVDFMKSSQGLFGGLAFVIGLACSFIAVPITISWTDDRKAEHTVEMFLYEIIRNPVMAEAIVLEKVVRRVDLTSFNIEHAKKNSEAGTKNGLSAVKEIHLDRSYVGDFDIVSSMTDDGEFKTVEKQPNSVTYNDAVHEGLMPEPADGSVKREWK